ncbi:efflux RND transporter permease subunit [Spirosoma flavum]|uniref:Efflux RND transporter permease subunit n=1 Tax=Spirosoma flavum TaxID=2048557 RepID=A0ABW6AQR0_9BACT
MQVYYGSTFASDFNRFGKFYRVIAPANAQYRADPSSLNCIYVKDASGPMVPMTTLVTLKRVYGPEAITRNNLFTSVAIYSTGDAIRAVLLSISTGILGVFGFINLAGIDNNIYVQVGLIMLIGLLAKNAILIVEFTIQRRQADMGLLASALEAAKLRLRPILMTSFAFIVGLVPLMSATGHRLKETTRSVSVRQEAC